MPSPRRTGIGFGLLVGIATIVAIAIAVVDTGSSEREDRFAACYFSEQRIEQELLAPRDAKFQSCRDRQVTRVGTDWVIRGRVDAPNVFGARLRITGLRAAGGPGIEFLEYLSPRDGRPMPPDERPNDLIHWQTVLLTRNLETITDHPSRPSLVSSGPVVLPDASLGFRKGALIRDPDGHVLLLPEP